MKFFTPFSKSICLLILLSLVLVSGVSAQRSGRAPQKSVSKAAGLVDEADKLADDRKYAEAIETYKIAIRLDPNYAPAFGGLGDAYLNSSNHNRPKWRTRNRCDWLPTTRTHSMTWDIQ